MIKKILLLSIIAIIGWLLWVAGFPLPYLINNHRLHSFAAQLDRIPLPPQTKKVGSVIKKFGNLGTCSKHGDYYAEFRIITSLSYPQLKTFYVRYTVQVPEISNVLFSCFRGLGTHGPQAIEIEKVEGAENSYMICTFDADYWPNDFRCW